MESYSYTVQNSSPVANIISLILCIIAIAGAWKVFVKSQEESNIRNAQKKIILIIHHVDK